VKALQSDGLSQRQACTLASCPRPTAQYVARRARSDEPLRSALSELAHERPRFGWRRLAILLRRQGLVANHKRLRRIYRAEGLQVRPRKKRRVRLVRGNVQLPVEQLNDEWGLDFMEDRLFHSRKIRALTIEDRLSREGLALEIDFSLTGRRVVRELDAIGAVRGYPKRLRVDNGPEQTSSALLTWSVARGVQLHFIDPGKPAQNAWIESFNARVRDEFFNLHLCRSLPEIRAEAATWLADYNEVRPHGSLANLTPKEFVDSLTISTLPQLSLA
jgi:putative transposase